MAYADNAGFNEHVEIWGLGDMDCTLFGEDLWKEWKIKENDVKIAEYEKKIHENKKKYTKIIANYGVWGILNFGVRVMMMMMRKKKHMKMNGVKK
jgi:hypothetical protein